MVFIYSYRRIFNFDIEWNRKSISLLAFLAVFPNVLGLFHVNLFGVNIHFFQYLIFLAAMIYGPLGGAISGAFGSVWTATSMHNPYIIAGNVILGLLVGLFIRLRWNVILAVLAAYTIQVPWLWYSDIYLANMNISIVKGVVVGLFVSNFIWSICVLLTHRHIKKLVCL